jgi:hypothetical protein
MINVKEIYKLKGRFILLQVYDTMEVLDMNEAKNNCGLKSCKT